MPDRKRPNDDRWSTHEALGSGAEGPRPWSLGHLRAKLTLLTYHPKFRKYRKVVANSTVGVLLVLGLLILGWRLNWFQDRADAPGVTSPRSESPEQKGKTGAPGELGSQAPSAEPKPTPDTAEAKPKEPLSDDVAKWSKDDRLRARKEHDPRLLQAVDYLGRHFPGDEPAARELAELLKPLQAKAPDAASPSPFPSPIFAPRPKPIDPSKLVQTIIAALGNNGSPSARNVLQQVLAGSCPTSDDRAAVTAVLETLAAHPCRENDALLASVAVAPDSVRPAQRQGPWSTREMQARALQFITSVGTEDLRVALAERLGDRFFQLGRSNPLYSLLDAADPVNRCAQLRFYELALRGDATEAMRLGRVRLAEQLLGYASSDLSRLLGIPEKPEMRRALRPSRVEKTPARELGWQFAAQLWSDRFAALLVPQLSNAAAQEGEPQSALLAAAIPRDWARASLSNYLRQHWSDGPRTLENAGVTGRLVVDPGVLVVVKMLPRKETKPVNRPPAGGKAPPTKAELARRAATQKKELTDKEWLGAMSQMAVTWCLRFRGAALAAAKSGGPAAGAAEGQQKSLLPADFELERDAKVLAAYHFVWPEQAPPLLGPPKPDWLEVYYLCAEETGRPKRTISFYNRQARARLADARPLNNSVWLESVRAGSQKDRRRSTDVLVTRAPGEAGKADLLADESQSKLIVEILSIEINDPAGKP